MLTAELMPRGCHSRRCFSASLDRQSQQHSLKKQSLQQSLITQSPFACPPPSSCRYLKREYSALKPFVIISLSYLLFTTTDGAIR
jgi:hypothetical protein